jgi:hypothetical protein
MFSFLASPSPSTFSHSLALFIAFDSFAFHNVPFISQPLPTPSHQRYMSLRNTSLSTLKRVQRTQSAERLLSKEGREPEAKHREAERHAGAAPLLAHTLGESK